VGAGIALIPGGEVVGGAIAFVGAGVSFVTGLIQERRDDDARQADTESLLKQVLAGTPGLTSAQVDTAARRLAGTEANLDGIARDAQLTPDQLVRLAASQPALDGLSSRDLDQVAKYSGLSGQAFVDWVARLSPQALNQLQSGVVTELKNGIEQGARQTAYQEALRAHDYEGKDFATVEAQVYQREYEKQMKDMLRGQGLIP
jgi:hypothetical protein